MIFRVSVIFLFFLLHGCCYLDSGHKSRRAIYAAACAVEEVEAEERREEKKRKEQIESKMPF